MNLLPKFKNKQTGQIGTPAEATPTTVLGDLTPLVNLIKPMRERMAEYDHAIHALAVARERLRDLADAPPPDMTLTVQREIAVAMGKPEVLARFDADNGAALEAERTVRETAMRDREELPGRIKALEEVVRQIAQRMIDHGNITQIEKQVQDLFAPYAQRLLDSANQYADAMQDALAVAWSLKSPVEIYEYDLFSHFRGSHRPELLDRIKEGILPDTVAGIDWQVIREVNERIDQIDKPLYERVQQELATAGLKNEQIRMYSPGAEDDPRRIYTPEITRRARRPEPPLSQEAAVVTIHT